VGAAQEFQARVVERLEAEREAVDAGGGEIGKARGVVGIGFECDFGAGLEAPEFVDPWR
jgi:hypothetical protein